ncbi:FHA domain-containing protein [Acetivibrio cellulolyticus]|uniref:FHA domain-containing protein n=1 Tax=Acetivibrio cellulolyticus TaxID=35830 RepID=UPI0001E2DF09|nr:FHA domain-containing protein [Acetivibrio cellulolyticus]
MAEEIIVCPECGIDKIEKSEFCEVCKYNFVMGEAYKPAIGTRTILRNTFNKHEVYFNIVINYDKALCEKDLLKKFPLNASPIVVPLDLQETLIGRSSTEQGIFPHININDPGVSHRHLKLIYNKEGNLEVLDLNTLNGTKLNSNDLEPGVNISLQDQDELIIGIWTRIKIQKV